MDPAKTKFIFGDDMPAIDLDDPEALYEVVGIRRDEGVALRDLRTGEITEVGDRAFSREAITREVICARALPAGSGHWFGPAVFTVPAGHQERLLEILDRPDGTSIADGLVSYFAAAPPGLGRW